MESVLAIPRLVAGSEIVSLRKIEVMSKVLPIRILVQQ